jgi:hypothetical protein
MIGAGEDIFLRPSAFCKAKSYTRVHPVLAEQGWKSPVRLPAHTAPPGWTLG